MKKPMDYQIALEACRAYKACHVTLRRLGLTGEADLMKLEEELWRDRYKKLADDEAQYGDELAVMSDEQ